MDLKIIDNEIWLGAYCVGRLDENLPHWLLVELRNHEGDPASVYEDWYEEGFADARRELTGG